jgi:hypothetical protein
MRLRQQQQQQQQQGSVWGQLKALQEQQSERFATPAQA